MHESDIEQQLIEFISNDLVKDELDEPISPDQDLLSSQLVDSLGVMQIVTFLEGRFGIVVPPTDVTIEHFIDVRSISRYISERAA